MAWNGSGTFTRTNGDNTGSGLWQQDKADGDLIVASRHDTHDQDLASGINACLAKNGENAMTGNLDMGSNSIISLANLTAIGTFSWTGNASIAGNASISGNITDVNSASMDFLTVSDTATFSNAANVTGAFSAGATTLNSTLAVTGATTLNSTLNVTNSVSLDNTLQVTNGCTFEGLVFVDNNVTISGYYQNPAVGSVPMRVKGITGTTVDLFQVYDDATKVFHVDLDGIATFSVDPKLYKADPILLIQDSDTGVATADSRLRLAESGGGGALDNYWDVTARTVNSSPDFSFHIEEKGAGSPHLTIAASSGNVGIGTQTPSSTLEVSGTITASGNADFQATTDVVTLNIDTEMTNTGDTFLEGGLVFDDIAAPSSASASGTAGEIRFDSNYMYRCVSANTWKRVALATW
jgi:hypothetical protein